MKKIHGSKNGTSIFLRVSSSKLGSIFRFVTLSLNCGKTFNKPFKNDA
jgi:hypothetical protein